MLCDYVINEHIDIFAVTETWLSGDERDDSCLADVLASLPNYSWLHNPRKDRHGGGVGICIRKGLRLHEYTTRTFSSFEYIDLLVTAPDKFPLRLVVIYRPQRTRSGELTHLIFLN